MVIAQYPDTINIFNDPELVQNEVSGNFEVPVDVIPDISSKCRCTPANNNPKVAGPDGAVLIYQWVVSMPPISTQIKFGTEVSLVTASGVFLGTVKQQQNGHFNTRLWV